jgi:hypothetical protein
VGQPRGSNVDTQTGGSTTTEQQLQQQLQQYQQRQEEQMQLMQQQMGALTALVTQVMGSMTAVSKTTATAKAATSVADSLPTPIPTFRRAPPNPRRLTFGLPAMAESPMTPITDRSTGRGGTDTADATGVPASLSTVPPVTLQQALTTMKTYVDPFYADSEKDKNSTVVDFVEKIESAMSDVLGDETHLRLAVVRMHLKEGALRWLNRQIQELRDAGVQSADWDRDVRKAFIEAHIGTDTVELWQAKLGELRLGKGKTKTPIELDNQFDTIARHVQPTLTAAERSTDLLLTTAYRDIIAASNPEMFATIVKTQPHRTLREWKTAVATQWNADAQIRAMHRQQNAAVNQYRGGSGRGRGGKGGSGGDRPAASAAALDVAGETGTDEGPGEESPRKEGQTDHQLTAAASANNSQRGGQGGRGGRGRGGARGRPVMSAEKQKLYDEQRCFRCHEEGHTVAGCPKPPTPHQQSK